MLQKINLSLRIFNIIVLVLAIAIWQFTFDSTSIYMIITLVVPAILVTYSEIKKKKYPTITALCLSFLFISYTYFPFNIIDVITFRMWPLIIIGILFFFLRPRTEYIGAYLYVYMSFYVYSFFTTIDRWSGNPFLQFREFYFSNEWFGSYSENSLFIFIVAFCIHLLIAIINKEFINPNAFYVLSSIVSLPLAFLGLGVIGFVYGIYLTIYTYITIFQGNVRPYKKVKDDTEQPAIEKYIFRKAFTDANTVMRMTYAENKANWKRVKMNLIRHRNVYGKVITAFVRVSSYTAIITIAIVGQGLLATASVVYFAAISLYSLPIFAFWQFCYHLDKGFRKMNHIKAVCASCYEISELPTYYCSNCRVAHTNLVPSKYGILKRTCQCGHQLSTSYFNGRRELAAGCQSCSTSNLSHESTPISIPIIGGAMSGKTSFMLASVRKLSVHSEATGIKVRFPDSSLQTKVNNYFHDLSPAKTNDRVPEAACVGLKHPKWRTEKMLYLYDPAGEVFENSSDLKKQKYLRYYDGNIFILDPFSSHSIREKLMSPIHAGSVEFENIFDQYLIELQESYGMKVHEKIQKPIAILIHKIDQGLESQMGEETMRKVSAAKENAQSLDDVTHQACIDFLSSMGMNNFLRKVDNKFMNYRFFACSSISEHKNTAEKPLSWLLSQMNKEWKSKQISSNGQK